MAADANRGVSMQSIAILMMVFICVVSFSVANLQQNHDIPDSFSYKNNVNVILKVWHAQYQESFYVINKVNLFS
jgi:lysophospholipid acyltransferase (LPLAT)-like uncharacterized protein